MRRQAKRRPSRGVGDELQNRWESIIVREGATRKEWTNCKRLPSRPRGIHPTTVASKTSFAGSRRR